MSYAEKSLASDEFVVYKTSLHWIIFSRWVVLAILLIFISSIINIVSLGLVLSLIPLIGLIASFIEYSTSEFAVINKRIMVKIGWIKRISLEMYLDKVESILVNQGILGRILNYGTIIIIGVGGTREPFKNVENPLELRKKILEQIEVLKTSRHSTQ